MKDNKPKYRNREWLREQVVEKELPDTEIANICNVHKSTIGNWRDCFDIEQPEPRYKNKEWLKEQYIEKELSDAQIANKVGVGNSTIWYWRQSFGISTRPHGEAVSLGHANNLEVTPELITFLDGTLLGDGSLQSSHGYSSSYCLTQKHHSYCKWMRRKLNNFGVKQTGKIYTREYSTKELAEQLGKKLPQKERILATYFYKSLSYRKLQKQRERWYPNGEKRVPKDLSLTPKNTLLWFLEDGSCSIATDAVIGRVQLATNCFPEKDTDFLINQLRSILDTSKIHKYGNSFHQYVIHFSSAPVVDSFFNYLAPLPQELYEDYSYKFPKAYL